MRLFGITIFTESSHPASSVTPWYLRRVPDRLASVVVALLALLVAPAILLLAAAFLCALAYLLFATGRGFVYVLMPASAVVPRPGHFGLALAIGAALWGLFLFAITGVVRWFSLSCSPRRLGPGSKPAA